MSYLIKGTVRGEQILFQGERDILLDLAKRLQESQPSSTVWVTDRPVDVFGNCLLLRARFD